MLIRKSYNIIIVDINFKLGKKNQFCMCYKNIKKKTHPI